MNAAIPLNTTYAKKPNLTELKVKKEFDCFQKKFQITSFKKLINRHFVALNILEFQVNSTNQPQFLIKIADPFKHLLCKGVFDNSNSISNYIKCVREHVNTKISALSKLKEDHLVCDLNLFAQELQNYQHTLNNIQLFFSLKDFYSSDFDNE